MTTNYTVKPNQSMPDVIIQATGSMEAGMQFCEDNGVSITDTPVAGTIMTVSDTAISLGDATVLQQFQQNAVVIGTLNEIYIPALYIKTRSLTIDHTKCGASDSSNFPVLVSITDTTLALIAHGGHVTNANGYDIQFFNDEACTVKLNWEVEYYNDATGTLLVWVKIPAVSHTADTIFYMQYGDATIHAFQGGATGSVWDSHYMMVQHLPNGTALSAYDATNNANNGVINSATAVAGIVDGGVSFDGISNGIEWISTNLPTGANPFSASAWLKLPAVPAGGQIWPVFTWGNQLSIGGAAGIAVYNLFGTTSLVFLMWDVDLKYTWVPAVNNWYHVTVTYDGSVASMYLNGTLVTSSARTLYINATHAYLGFLTGAYASYYSPVVVDEVRASNTVRGADWVLTEYNNINNPGNIASPGFISFSTEL